eukprot:Hpha_TRINITY_DN3359_c0_g1::TRINITY_DN3359_c0_g1_i1::g.172434::m.172434
MASHREWPPPPDQQDAMRKFYYPPADKGNPMRPMAQQTVCVDRQRSGRDAQLLLEWAERLSAAFSTLSELRHYIESLFDPCCSGFIGLGDFLCLWFKKKPWTSRRSYADQLGLMGVSPPAVIPQQSVVLIAAVAAALGTHTLQRDMQRTDADTRFSDLNFGRYRDELRKSGVWYGGWGWRKPIPIPPVKPPEKERDEEAGKGNPQLLLMLKDGAARRHAQDRGKVHFSPYVLYRLREFFDKYDENDGSTPGDATAHIRFGMVSSFLFEIGNDPELGPFFALKQEEVQALLNDLVRHANDSMRDLRESALEARQTARRSEEAGLDYDCDPGSREVLAGMLERARACLRDRRPRQAMRETELAVQRALQASTAPRPPPYFEEPSFNFCNILALLLKYMVAPGEADGVLRFFNDGIGMFYSLMGQGPPRAGLEAVRPRVLPVRALLRELAHYEIAHPGSTSFTDATHPFFAGPDKGRWDPQDFDAVPTRRRMPSSSGGGL